MSGVCDPEDTENYDFFLCQQLQNADASPDNGSPDGAPDTSGIAGGGAGPGGGQADVGTKAGRFGTARKTTTVSTPWSIPENILADINNAADNRLSGAPVSVIASTMWNLAHGWTKWTPDLIAQLAMRLKQGHDQYVSAPRPGAEPVDEYTAWLNAATDYASQASVGSSQWNNARSTLQAFAQRNFDPGPASNPPTGKYNTYALPEGLGNKVTYGVDAKLGGTGTASDIQDVYDYFQSFLGRDPTSDAEAQQYVGMSLAALRVALENTPEGKDYRQYGTQVKALKEQATGMWRQFLGRDPTTAELVNAVKSGLTDVNAVETFLRSQPYGKSTMGTLSDVRTLAKQYAQQYLGRNPDTAGQEINWLISNGKTTDKDISAFYEQLKQRTDSGDQSFAWAADPDTWTMTQRQLQQIWSQEGLRGQVDPRFVNDAIKGNWTMQDMKDHIDNLDAPGFPTGVKVGEVNRVRQYAQQWKDHYIPGATVTNSELTKFLNMTSEEVQGYYRSLPLQTHLDALAAGAAEQGQPIAQPQYPQAYPTTQGSTTTTTPTTTTTGAAQPKTQSEGAPAPTPTDATKKFLEQYGYKG